MPLALNAPASGPHWHHGEPGVRVSDEGRGRRQDGGGPQGGLEPRMTALPVAAQLYVSGVIAAGAALLVYFFPLDTFRSPAVFLVLLILSSLTSVFKVKLPLARSGSTMSVSYAVDFAALLLLGPNETMLVAATSAWSQCTFRIEEPNALHRTLFSMACLVVTVQAAGHVYYWLGGVPPGGRIVFVDLPKPLLGAATVYFLLNTVTIATAIALSTRQSLVRVWNENFLWSAPSYFVGALAAAVGAWVIQMGGYWMAALAVCHARVYATSATQERSWPAWDSTYVALQTNGRIQTTK